MTGKELLFVFGGSMLAAAGTASVVTVQSGGGPDQAVDTAKIDARLERIENVLEKTAESIRRNHGKLNDLGERMTGVEMQAAQAVRTASERRIVDRTETVMDGEDVEVEMVPGGFDVEGFDPSKLAELKARLAEQVGSRGLQLGGLTGPDGEPLEGHVVRLGTMVDSLRNGLELRKLPEAERWEKAQDDLGLSYNQVESLKQAVATRDEAMKAAMIIDRDEETETGRFTIKRMDPAKVAQAQSDYHKSVNDTLASDEQRKGWREKGYDRAFGGSGGGTISVMTIGSTMTTDSKKSDE